MRLLKPVLIPLLVLPLGVLGCTRKAQEPAATTQSAPAREAVPAPSAAADVSQVVLGSVELGKSLSPDGDVTSVSTTFRTGEPVYAGVEATSLSPGTTIRLDWVGPRGVSLGSDDLVVPPDARVITLKAKDTSSWKPGDYRVEVAVGGAKVGSKSFTVTAPSA
jgi:hypothetical protein